MSTFAFVMDSNVFIEAHRRYYSFPICPGFWDAIARHHKTGQVCSIDRVLRELTQTADELGNWVKGGVAPSFFRVTTGEPVVDAFAKVARWVDASPQYAQAAKRQFLGGADPWLIAYCVTEKATLVTQEVPAPQAQNKVPIPNVCNAFHVPTCNTFELLRQLPAVFHLSE